MKILIFALYLMVASFTARAAEESIVVCRGESKRFSSFYIELFRKQTGEIASKYSVGEDPYYYPTWTTLGQIVVPPKIVINSIFEANRYRKTGIDPNQVKLFQNIFIDGSNRWSIELWKLMDNKKRELGWMAHAFQDVLGCY